ncbi:MAG: hypothetical protein GC154_03785 [bacterium]|nr:hypothetical protein [bacterium]
MKRFPRLFATLTCILLIAGSIHPAARAAEGDLCFYGLFPPQLVDGVYPRHYRPNRTVDFKHMTLNIQVFMDEQRVEGVVHYLMTPLHDAVTTVRLDAVDMEILDVRSTAGVPFSWNYFDNQVYVTFEKPLPVNESELSIQYKAQPKDSMYFSEADHMPAVHPDQMYTLCEPFGASMWFPANDYPNDRMQTEMVATVPKQFVTLSNGLLIDSKEDGAWRTDHWKMEIPHASYLVSLVVGDFDVVHDEWRGKPVDYYVEAGRAEDAMPSLGKTPDMLEFFSEFLDYPYPYEKYAQSMVRYFLAGGMEHTSATTMFEYLTIDKEARVDTHYDWLIMHEMAHQWFGDLLTCEKWGQLWLNESFATYTEALWERHAEGEDSYELYMREKAETYIGESHSYTRAIDTNEFADPREMFDRHTYPKGGFVLYMLHQQLGEDLFRKSMHQYLVDNAPGLVDTDDYMEAIEKATGKPMDRFFEQWIYSPGHPKVKVSHEWLPDTKQVKLHIQQTQEMEKGRPAFAFPLEIEIPTPSGVVNETIQIGLKDETAFIDCPDTPGTIDVDPHGRVLMELDHNKSLDMNLYDLQHGSTGIVMIRAIEPLKNEREPRVVDALAACASSDANYRVRVEAAAALGVIQTPEAKAALLSLTGIENHDVRESVMRALGRFRDDADAIRALRTALDDKAIHVVAAAARALARADENGAASAVRPLLNRPSHRETIRTAAIGALVGLKDKSIFSTLVKYSKDPYHRDLRIPAIQNIGQLAYDTKSHEKEALDLLVDRLDSNDPRVRGAAIAGLKSLRNEDAIPYLQRYAEGGAAFGGSFDPQNLRKQASDAIASIRRDRESELAAKNAERLDKMELDRKKLQDRVDELEQTLKKLSKSANNTQNQ